MTQPFWTLITLLRLKSFILKRAASVYLTIKFLSLTILRNHIVRHRITNKNTISRLSKVTKRNSMIFSTTYSSGASPDSGLAELLSAHPPIASSANRCAKQNLSLYVISVDNRDREDWAIYELVVGDNAHINLA
ncbi:hypothetical protein HUJ05_007794 [Dendroctonus ponderosae]|nr:hypothetical protein HUJ05_007794 [Dendroctonus ponderosae]